MLTKIFKPLLFICIACIPLVQWSLVLDTTMLPRQLYFSVFVVIGVFAMLLLKKNTFYFNPIHIGLFALLLLSSFSILYAFNSAEAYYTSCKFSLSLLVFTTLYALLTQEFINIKTISRAVLVFLLLACGYQIYEILKKGNLWLLAGKNIYEINGLFGHKNLFSSIVFLGFPFLIYICVYERKFWQLLGILLSITALVLLLFVQTKAVLLAILLGIGISAIVLFTSLSVKRMYKVLILSGMAFFVLLVAFMAKEKLPLLSNNDTIKERILLWSNTWQLIKEHPLSGVGAGNWQIFFPKYGLQNFMQTNYLISDGYTTFQRPHNDFLWVWSEMGVLALITYIGIFALGLYYCFKNILAAQAIKAKVFHSGLLMTLIGYVFIGFVDFPLERSEHQFFLLLILALVSNHYFTYKKTLVVTSRWIAPFIIVCALLNSLVFSKRVEAEAHSRKLVLAHHKNNWSLMIQEAKKASNAFYTIDNFSIPLPWYAGVAYSALGNNEYAKPQFEKAYTINPYQIHVLNNIASINEIEGKHDIALKYYNEALAISPSQPDALLNKSAVLFNKGNINEAFTTILQFKFDENNTQFKNYFIAIARQKLEKDLQNNQQEAAKCPLNLSEVKNDTALLKNFNKLKTIYLLSH
jgi:O-antigen ligase